MRKTSAPNIPSRRISFGDHPQNWFGFPVLELKCTQHSTREVKPCSQHLPPVLGSVDSLIYRLGIAKSSKM